MSLSLTPNAKETLTLDRPVRTIEVSIGKIMVTTPHVAEPDEDTAPVQSTIVDAPDTFEGNDQAGLVVHDITGSRITITYSDEAEPVVDVNTPTRQARRKDKRRASSKAAPAKRKATERGDTGGGDSGGFESRTVKQLRAEAKKRKLDVPSRATKDQLIKALRNG